MSIQVSRRTDDRNDYGKNNIAHSYCIYVDQNGTQIDFGHGHGHGHDFRRVGNDQVPDMSLKALRKILRTKKNIWLIRNSRYSEKEILGPA